VRDGHRYSKNRAGVIDMNVQGRVLSHPFVHSATLFIVASAAIVKLYESGALSKEEFDAPKSKLIGEL